MSLSCIIIDDEAHAISEITDLIEDNVNLDLDGTFMDAADAVEFLEDEGNVDIVFCDVNMPNMDGLNAAKLLHPFCRFLVFVTGYREYALNAFEKNAAGYLVKPLQDSAFNDLVTSFIKKDKELLSTNLMEKQGVLFVKGGGKNEVVKVDLDNIQYVTAQLNYSMICLSDQTNIITYILLGDFEKKLKVVKSFFRVNRSNIISMRFFKKIDGNRVHLTTGESFTLSPKYKAALLTFVKIRSLNL